MRAYFAAVLRRAVNESGQANVGSGSSPTGDTALASGNNTVTFPTQVAGDTAGALICLVEPQIAEVGGTQPTYILKGVNGDTGQTQGATGCPFLIPGLSATTFVVNVSANTSARISFTRVQ